MRASEVLGNSRCLCFQFLAASRHDVVAIAEDTRASGGIRHLSYVIHGRIVRQVKYEDLLLVFARPRNTSLVAIDHVDDLAAYQQKIHGN